MTTEHPFAPFIRIIGKGPQMSRCLTEDEAYEATRMIMAGDVEPIQLGAFLCILRVRTEVPEEGAGFVRAVRDSLALPEDKPHVDLDWASYSGKLRQLPWFLPAALLLAANGVRICMHGTEGHTEGRTYTSDALKRLGIPVATNLADAAQQIEAHNFAYIGLKDLAPRLQEIIELKWVLGLRSPVNTFARMINPFGADHEIQSVFHPNYRDIHRQTSKLLGQPKLAVFKGEGGEVERRPNKPVEVQTLRDGDLTEEVWPPLLDGEAALQDAGDIDRLVAVWRGDIKDAYGEAAVIGTLAIALRLLGKAPDPEAAIEASRLMWNRRSPDLHAKAA